MRPEENRLLNVFESFNQQNILLPNFQRNFIWDYKRQGKLLASAFLDFPIGSILFLNGIKRNFASKEAGRNRQIIANTDESCKFLLDGQQRLTTLYYAFNDMYEDSDDVTSITQTLGETSKALKHRWFIKLPERDDSSIYDFFGYKKLHFNREILNEKEPEDIKDVFTNYNFNTNLHRSDHAYSPYYRFNHDLINDNNFETNSAEYFKANKLIPLYRIKTDLFDGVNHNGILGRTIRLLAGQQIEYLKEEYTDNEDLIALLSTVDYDQVLLDENIDNNIINELWERLKTTWVRDVLDFLREVIENFTIYSFETDDLRRAIPIFQELNMGGVKLDDYDLIVAKYAQNHDDNNLPKNLSLTIKEFVNNFNDDLLPNTLVSQIPVNIRPSTINLFNMDIINENDYPVGTFKTETLKMLSIFAHSDYRSIEQITPGIEKTSRLFELSAEDIEENLEDAVKSVHRALTFAQVRLGVIKAKDFPYKLFLLPIAYILKDDDSWNDEEVLNRIEFWYWSSFFSGYFHNNQNQKSINEIKNLYSFIVNNNDIGNINERRNEIFNHTEYTSYESIIRRNESSTYDAILQYVLSTIPIDFSSDNFRLRAWALADSSTNRIIGDISYKNKINDHHIFPLGQATLIGQTSRDLRGEKGHILNCALNRALISEGANMIISDMSPNRYLEQIGGEFNEGAIIHNYFLPNPTDYSIQTGEEWDDVYSRIISTRFDNLRNAINGELGSLI